MDGTLDSLSVAQLLLPTEIAVSGKLSLPLSNHVEISETDRQTFEFSSQQNLDYLHQMTNGWLMGKTGYEMGSYKNLAVCHD